MHGFLATVFVRTVFEWMYMYMQAISTDLVVRVFELLLNVGLESSFQLSVIQLHSTF